MSTICVICARGGSKGLPNKNIRPLLGKPLLAWTIEQAKASKLFELVAVSSDASSILDVACSAGADLLVDRPAELASDTVSVLPAILHCLRAAEASAGHACETLVCLQATSPTRTVDDIRDAVALFHGSHADAVISGQEAKGFTLFQSCRDGGGRLRTSVEAARQADRAPARRARVFPVERFDLRLAPGSILCSARCTLSKYADFHDARGPFDRYRYRA